MSNQLNSVKMNMYTPGRRGCNQTSPIRTEATGGHGNAGDYSINVRPWAFSADFFIFLWFTYVIFLSIEILLNLRVILMHFYQISPYEVIKHLPKILIILTACLHIGILPKSHPYIFYNFQLLLCKVIEFLP